MAKLDIKIYDHPVLRTKAQRIERITERHRLVGADMAETMYAFKGIGLAANQIGLLERIIVVDVNWSERDGRKAQPRTPTVMINPEILEEDSRDEVLIEGCLSLPDIEGDVWRSVRIRYRYQNLDGNTIEAEATDLQARCILHEIDHLDGIMFIDRMVAEERQKLAGKLSRLRRANPAGIA